MKKQVRKDSFNKECEWVFTKPMYHRGKWDNEKVYENTLDAYKASLNDNAPYEFDVQLTNDGEVICLHDISLKRLFNREREVIDISYKRINKLRDDLKVPLLKDVLKVIDGKVELMIELKSTKSRYNKELVKRVYNLLKDYKGKYVIVSFNPFILHEYRKLDKNAYLGRIGSKEAKTWIQRKVISKYWFNSFAKPDFVSYDIYHYDQKQLDKFKKKGYRIVGWPLRKKEDLTDELKANFENFIIERMSVEDIKEKPVEKVKKARKAKTTK